MIEVREGGPVGQVLRNDEGHAIRIIDIMVANSWRGRGIGEAVLRSILDEAKGMSKRVELQVAVGAQARRLYRRLGFETVNGNEVMEQMVWKL
jgi:ribosomal protein S18 acetylase RimI-like enzyme